jgi:arylsulfatase A-like enzyme
MPARALLALALILGASSCAKEARSVLLVTLDTTRADALGAYGRTPSVTPNLDQLAQDAMLFERAFSVAPLTLPAHASMLTGLTPLRHGVRDNGLVALPSSAVTLAEVLHGAGLETAAFLGAAVLERGFGLEQGFETYAPPARRFYGEAEPGYAERPAGEVVARALEWLAGRDEERPFFLWTHLWDAHAPYEPPPGLLTRAGGDAYLGEVAACDLALGRLLTALEERGLDDSTLVVVVGDHGEAFGEHGEVSHGPYVWDSTLRVPLLIRRPGGAGGGERVSELASVVDVLPTVLAALDVEGADDLDGIDLLSDAREEERGLYFESYYGHFNFGWHPLAGWRSDEGKWIHGARDLFFAADDGDEERDLASASPELVARHAAALDELAGQPRLAPDAEGIDPELKRALAGLGYAAMAGENTKVPEPTERLELADPHARTEELAALQQGTGELAAGQLEAAERTLTALARAHPENAAAQDRLAQVYLLTQRHALARAPLERVVAGGRGNADTWAHLGACHLVGGDDEKALASFLRALELDPYHVHALKGLIHLMESAGMAAQAEPFRARFQEVQGRP